MQAETMETALNYHHLQCFWLVARRGGLAAAGRALHVTPSTVWAQLKAIEDRLGVRLLERRGRRLELTAPGERVARVADELFALGREVLAVAQGGVEPARTPGRVGVVAAVPRLVANRVLAPALEAGLRVRVTHGTAEDLLGQLAARRLDVVLSDDPSRGVVKASVANVGSSRLAVFCTPALERALAPGFPRSLDDAPFVLPAAATTQRDVIDAAFARLGVHPRVVAEADDSALLKALAAEGAGVVVAPELLRGQLKSYFGLRELGRLAASVSFHLLTLDPRRLHPVAAAMHAIQLKT
ncbi:MAG: LysR family transcriptional regulator [Archangium sp.]|nr:LysR family transcriptional regulator [Archangium sp.]